MSKRKAKLKEAKGRKEVWKKEKYRKVGRKDGRESIRYEEIK